ncbi:hypothetical protein PH5382_03687 [Phaeobacter sp. CECT 5382]|uniref:hypothetical protein n=1 Tax=Phaeobacter sp. CECT 5382 TaxID=1712645 RepID=UPI0006DAD531|nr:hypothetical protein [Phaeobacter sp. CECT 5382]CUH89735.1 hypothetical protein PH5382_03687 [Phaeobacter sp. CECT 5382]
MSKRAIILVPGFGKREQLEARGRLVESLTHYSDGYVTETAKGSDTADSNSVVIKATARDGTQPDLEVHVFEAYWGDLIPDWDQESPWARAKRGFALILYWAFGGLGRALLRRELPARTMGVMAAAGLLLLLWYLLALTVLFQALGPEVADVAKTTTEQVGQPTGVPGWLTAVLPDGWLTPERIASFGNLNQLPVIAFLIGLIGIGHIEKVANVAAFTKAYLKDEALGDASVGLRAKARHRVLPVLDQVYASDQNFDEVYVVAHSLGGAVAIDALAECGAELARTTLFTWGSAIGVMVQQEPLIEAEIRKFYHSPTRIRNWVDVVVPGDFMGSKVPIPKAEGTYEALPQLFPKTQMPPKPRGMMLQLNAQHEYYYRCEAAILMLLNSADNLPQPVALAGAVDGLPDLAAPAP